MEVVLAALVVWAVAIPAALVGAAWLRVRAAERRAPLAEVIDLDAYRSAAPAAYAARR